MQRSPRAACGDHRPRRRQGASDFMRQEPKETDSWNWSRGRGLVPRRGLGSAGRCSHVHRHPSISSRNRTAEPKSSQFCSDRISGTSGPGSRTSSCEGIMAELVPAIHENTAYWDKRMIRRIIFGNGDYSRRGGVDGRRNAGQDDLRPEFRDQQRTLRARCLVLICGWDGSFRAPHGSRPDCVGLMQRL